MKKRSSLTWARLRQLAVEAECDPRTIDKILGGESVKGEAVSQRARAVLMKHGLMNADGTLTTPEARCAD